MSTHADFEELLRLLEESGVNYLVVGGYAVAFHGYPRFTGDIDIFFSPEPDNVARLRKALIQFAFDESDVPAEVFSVLGNIVTFGSPPCRVDMMNSISGVSFDAAFRQAVTGKYGNVAIKFISLMDLINNKIASGRAKDRADVEELLSVNGIENP